MMREPERQLIPPQYLTCPLCELIFSKPITLSCGHTFCKQCLCRQMRPRSRSQHLQQPHQHLQQPQTHSPSPQVPAQQRKQKVSVCHKCQSIIWRGIPQMKENIVIQNLVSRLYPEDPQRRHSADLTKEMLFPTNPDTNDTFYNKIVITLKQEPLPLPMPYAYSEIVFETPFIDDVNEQAQAIVVTWPSLRDQKRGILGRLQKIGAVDGVQGSAKVVVYEGDALATSVKGLDRKYKAIFLGITFVTLQYQQLISINLQNKVLLLSPKDSHPQVFRHLQICDCRPLHAARSASVHLSQFQSFFRVYQQMNNHHFLRQIRLMISDAPFQSRTDPQTMIYCVLRLLRMPAETKRQLLLCFDDRRRMDGIVEWLGRNKDRPFQEVMEVKIPGNFNSGVVFFIIFLLFVYNLVLDYTK